MSSARNFLRENLSNLLKNEEAVNFCCDVFDIAQGFDDIYDKDADKKGVYDLLWLTIFRLPHNQFFSTFRAQLDPLLMSLLLQWQSANVLEENKGDLNKAYMLRAFFYQLCHFCAALLHGFAYAQEQSVNFQSLYGESFAEYSKEFSHA
jgi:hypothetical protein